MDNFLLIGAGVILGAILYFLFFRETRSVSVGPIGEPPLEPLAPRDWLKAELAEFNGQRGKPIHIAGRSVLHCLCVFPTDRRPPLTFAVDGIVFNMSSHPTGASFYGPGGPYGLMAGWCVCYSVGIEWDCSAP